MNVVDRISLPNRPNRAVVMTMGALHAGHASLIRAARKLVGADGEVVATIFVNPLQFGPDEDYERYPRTLAADLELCESLGVDTVFTPKVSDVYPQFPPLVSIDPGWLGESFEGVSRPGHFVGVATVVTKLLQLVEPRYALYGEKDYQQLVVLRHVVADLNLRVQVVGVPIVRDEDGLALSSRNVYLSDADRKRALAIPRAVAAATVAEPLPVAEIERTVRAKLVGVDEVDYAAVVGPDLRHPTGDRGRLLVAARVGQVRLLDNAEVAVAS